MIKLISRIITIILILFINIGSAQEYSSNIINSVQLSGPRFGVTMVGGKYADDLKSNFNANPVFTQFGWQFETRFFDLDNGTAGLIEGVILAGGMEQNKIFPSANFLIGLRNSKGLEFGFGPTLSLAGIGFVFAGGITFSSNNINFPINLAIAPSTDGIRVSLLAGFNARKK